MAERKQGDPRLIPKSFDDYKSIDDEIRSLSHERSSLLVPTLRARGEADLYFFMRYVLSTKDIVAETNLGRMPAMHHPYLYRLAREVQYAWEDSATEKMTLFMRFRSGFKSTTITFALPLQVVLRDPSEVLCIFSARKKLAELHVGRIKNELDTNDLLRGMYPDRIWSDPERDSPSWSVTKGIQLIRPVNRIEPTIFTGGFLSGQPTGTHPTGRIYDDIEDPDSVTNREMRSQVYGRYQYSTFLRDTAGPVRSITAGTYYHHDGVYSRLEREGKVKVNRMACVDVGKPADEGYESLGGKSVFIANAELLRMRSDMKDTPGKWAQQMMLDAKGDATTRLSKHDIRWYANPPFREGRNKNVYIVVDPARHDGDDDTAMAVWGLGPDRNYYLLDLFLGQIDVVERMKLLCEMHRRWNHTTNGRVMEVRWEEAGQREDVSYIERYMAETNYRFSVKRVRPFGVLHTGGKAVLRKSKRIDSVWAPLLRAGRIWFPDQIISAGRDKTDLTTKVVDQIADHPVGDHDDFLDTLVLLHLDEDKYGSITWPRAHEGKRYGLSYGVNHQSKYGDLLKGLTANTS